MIAEVQAQAAAETTKAFDAGETIMGHVANSSHEHALIHLPTIFGIDMSVTKHVFMLWFVAAVVFIGVTALVRRSVKRASLTPTGPMNALEIIVEFVRDDVALPNLGAHWTAVWTPFLLTVFVFILAANLVGLIPIFDVLGLIDHYGLHTADGSFIKRLIHGGSTATGNYNVTAGLAVVTFFAVIIAGSMAHGFVKHWKNMVPPGLPKPLYVLLIPMEIISTLVRPFALTMRLAANMTGGHIAILAIMSFVFIFAQLSGTLAGVGTGLVFSVPLAVAISGLEIIVILVQAYVFALLSAVFIGMATNSHH